MAYYQDAQEGSVAEAERILKDVGLHNIEVCH